MSNKVAEIAKAIIAGVGAAASYFIAVLGAEGSFGDLSTSQWLAVIPVIAAVYGVTWAVPNRPPVSVGEE